MYSNPRCQVIDSALYVQDGVYYLFVKNETNPAHVQLFSGPTCTGPWTRIPAMDEEMDKLEQGKYEAPTAFRAQDGRWCLFLDFYGVKGDGQGYVPFIADDIATGRFIRSDADFSFPYGFKHGTILSITE